MFLDEQRIIHSMKSLWWFYQNLPLCKNVPADYETIQSKCPNIIREKVCDLLLRRALDTYMNNSFGTNNVMQQQRGANGPRTGSGRILKKSFSFNPEFSKSLDGTYNESVDNHTNNYDENSVVFRRATSSMCLNRFKSTHPQMMAAREA